MLPACNFQHQWTTARKEYRGQPSPVSLKHIGYSHWFEHSTYLFHPPKTTTLVLDWVVRYASHGKAHQRQPRKTRCKPLQAPTKLTKPVKPTKPGRYSVLFRPIPKTPTDVVREGCVPDPFAYLIGRSINHQYGILGVLPYCMYHDLCAGHSFSTPSKASTCSLRTDACSLASLAFSSSVQVFATELFFLLLEIRL